MGCLKPIAIEDVLYTRGAVKTLRLLAEFGELNASAISRLVGLSYSSTIKSLERLSKMGLLIEKRFGRVRVYQLNPNCPYANLIREMIMRWNDLNARIRREPLLIHRDRRIASWRARD